jgi:hypothetical protein
MTSPEVDFERFLHVRHDRGEKKYAHMLGRLAVEELPADHFYRSFARWMNQQLSDIGSNSTGGVHLPQLHFELVRVQNGQAAAHVFETDEYGFIVMTQPMFDEMLNLSRSAVAENWAFMTLQIAPGAGPEEIAQLLLLMQFTFVMSHEYSHLVRQHLADHQPHAAQLGESLVQAQEFDADGYAIYHELTYFFHGDGRQIASKLLRLSRDTALESSILSCFLLSTMVQFCARWAGKIQIATDRAAEHPPVAMRIHYAMLVSEMWCREVGGFPTAWMTDGTLPQHFDMASRLFPQELKASWRQQISWLKAPSSEKYRNQIEKAISHIRTGKD